MPARVMPAALPLPPLKVTRTWRGEAVMILDDPRHTLVDCRQPRGRGRTKTPSAILSLGCTITRVSAESPSST